MLNIACLKMFLEKEYEVKTFNCWDNKITLNIFHFNKNFVLNANLWKYISIYINEINPFNWQHFHLHWKVCDSFWD